MHSYTSIPRMKSTHQNHTFNPLVDRSKVPKNNPRLLHSKDCLPGLHKRGNHTKRDKMHTTQHRHHRPAQFKFKSNPYYVSLLMASLFNMCR